MSEPLPTPLYATLHTNHGDVKVELFPLQAPKTVRNFVELAEGTKAEATTTGKFYDGLTFHRIIPGFMIQGGCPQGSGTGGPGYTFDDEITSELNFTQPYMLAMANAGLRGGKGTNGSQFFVTTGPTTWLQGKHTIFGQVADGAGRAVIDEIGGVKTGAMDRPVEPVVIESVTIERP